MPEEANQQDQQPNDENKNIENGGQDPLTNGENVALMASEKDQGLDAVLSEKEANG